MYFIKVKSLIPTLLCLLNYLGQGLAEKTMAVQIALDKLDTFVAKGLPQSDLTFADLQSAYIDLKELDADNRRSLEKEHPLLKKLTNFLLTSMEKHPTIFTSGIWKEPADNFMRKLEKYYKEIKSGNLKHETSRINHGPADKPSLKAEEKSSHQSYRPPTSYTMSMQMVLDKLEAFVTRGMSQSDLTFADLQAAYWDFQKLGPSHRVKLKLDRLLVPTVSDFLRSLIGKHPNVFTNGHDVTLGNIYIRQLEKLYKEVRTAYIAHVPKRK